MAEGEAQALTPGQVAVLERLVAAGFRFVTLEKFARFPAAEKDGFVALLDTAGGKIRIFGQAGYLMGEGIGMLIDRGEHKTFVWHGEACIATPQLLEAYARFKAELKALLEK